MGQTRQKVWLIYNAAVKAVRTQNRLWEVGSSRGGLLLKQSDEERGWPRGRWEAGKSTSYADAEVSSQQGEGKLSGLRWEGPGWGREPQEESDEKWEGKWQEQREQRASSGLTCMGPVGRGKTLGVI